MHRRTVLASAAGLSLPLAGCTSLGSFGGSSNAAAEAPTASLEMTPVDDSELPAKVLYSPVNGRIGRKATLLDRILDGGASVKGVRPPLPEDQDIAYNGTVYRLSRTTTGKTPATRYSVKVDVVEGSVNDSTAIHFADLPKVDREKFADHGLAGGGTVGIGTTFLYTDAERAKSALVPSSNYSFVVWKNGSQAKWVVDDADGTTLNTYSYTAESVASASEYGRWMRERFGFELPDLPDDQQKIVTAVMDGDGYVVGPDESPPAALRALVDRFRNHEQAHGLHETGEDDLGGTYLVRYGNELYWTTLLVSGDAFRTDTLS